MDGNGAGPLLCEAGGLLARARVGMKGRDKEPAAVLGLGLGLATKRFETSLTAKVGAFPGSFLFLAFARPKAHAHRLPGP